jgi:hypothetical protein
MNPLVRIAVAVAAFLHAAPMPGATEDPRSIEEFDDLRLRSIGPAVMGGRIDVVVAHQDRPWVLYIGAASGGVWKSVNMGTTWQSIFDGHETSSIGDIAVAPSDPEIVWVGTGEPNNRQSSSFGYGVYKSEDGGATFQHVGLERTGHIGQDRSGPRATSEASSGPGIRERPGRRCSSWTKTPAPSTWSWIQRTPTYFMPRSISGGECPGVSRAAV